VLSIRTVINDVGWPWIDLEQLLEHGLKAGWHNQAYYNTPATLACTLAQHLL